MSGHWIEGLGLTRVAGLGAGIDDGLSGLSQPLCDLLDANQRCQRRAKREIAARGAHAATALHRPASGLPGSQSTVEHSHRFMATHLSIHHSRPQKPLFWRS